MSVTNTVIGQVKYGDAINSTTSCTGSINENGKYYTGGAQWDYSPGIYAQYRAYVFVNHSVDNPWIKKLNWSSDWTGVNLYITGNTQATFARQLGIWSTHRIAWTLTSTGTCSAQGFIS